MTPSKRKSAVVIKCATPTCKARLFFYDDEQIPAERKNVLCPRCRARRQRKTNGFEHARG